MPVDLLVDVVVAEGDFRLALRLEVDETPVVLVGPNGAGKTTLLRLLAGGIVPVKGRVVVGGRTWVDTERGVFLAPRARRVGYLPQGLGLFPHLSVLDNVAYGIGDPQPRVRALELLDQLGVAHLAARRPGRLSGGEQQRVALARALGTAPDLLLLDEPTASLDVEGRRDTRALLASHLADPDRLAVAVTHDVRDLVAWRPRVALLRSGRLEVCAPFDALRGHADPFLEELLAPLA